MATVDRAARVSAREKAPSNKSRDEAARVRRVEAILDRRAAGEKVGRIAEELRITRNFVEETIARARQEGDARALTDKQACGVAAVAKRAADRVAAEDAGPPDAIAQAMRALTQFVQAEAPKEAAAEAEGRIDIRLLPTEAYVHRLRDMAANYRVVAPNVGAHFLHLADLYENCDRQYPELNLPSSGLATLESTDRRFPRHTPLASMSSPTARCGEV